MLGAPLEAGQRNKMSANLWERLFFECAIIDRWCLISHDMAISSTVSSQTKNYADDPLPLSVWGKVSSQTKARSA